MLMLEYVCTSQPSFHFFFLSLLYITLYHPHTSAPPIFHGSLLAWFQNTWLGKPPTCLRWRLFINNAISASYPTPTCLQGLYDAYSEANDD